MTICTGMPRRGCSLELAALWEPTTAILRGFAPVHRVPGSWSFGPTLANVRQGSPLIHSDYKRPILRPCRDDGGASFCGSRESPSGSRNKRRTLNHRLAPRLVSQKGSADFFAHLLPNEHSAALEQQPRAENRAKRVVVGNCCYVIGFGRTVSPGLLGLASQGSTSGTYTKFFPQPFVIV